MDYGIETMFEDHCATCGSVAEREALLISGRGEWTCEDCGNVTHWDTLDALRAALR